MTLRAEVLTGLRWTAGARLLAQVITWTITLIVIRILSPSDYGLLSMATVFVAFLTLLSDFGLGFAVIQRTEVDLPTLRKVFGIVVVVHVSAAILLIVAAPLIASFFTEPRVEPIVRVLALQFVIAAFAVLPDAQLQRQMEFRRRSLLELSGAIVGSVTTLVLALNGEGVWALVIGTLISQVWRTVGLNSIAPFRYSPLFTFSGLHGLMRFGWQTIASQVLWFFYTQIDIVIAGRWLGKEIVGFYSVAVHLASLPNQRVSNIINQIAFPAFARIQTDIAAVGSHMLLGVRLLTFFAFPVLWGVSSVAPELVLVVLGPKWAPSALPLLVIGLVMPLRIITNVVANAIRGIGRTDILLGNAIFASLILPPAFLVGVNWALPGLSIAWLATAPFLFLQSLMRSLPAIDLRIRDVAKAMMRSTGAGTLMYAAVLVTRVVLPATLNEALRLCVLIFAGAIVYCVSSFLLNRKGLVEALSMLKSIAAPRTRLAE